MNFRITLLTGAIILLLLNSGCKESPVEPAPTVPASTLTGRVLQAGTNNSVVGAIVSDIGPRSLVDTTNNQGQFSLSYGVLSSAYTAQLRVTALGYFTRDTNLTVSVGRDTSLTIRLAIQDSARISTGISGPAASIVLTKQTYKTIALRGTGLNESSKLTFKVVDSIGNSVVGVNRSLVSFRLSGGPNAGEFLSPSSAWTDAAGEASTTVTSGTNPGVLQVIASARNDSVKASPVFLTAGGGFPDSANVSIAASKVNIAGRIYANLKTNISLFVGDRFGNPVADGTSVVFMTNGGIILPSATTKDGVATVELKSGGGSPPPGGRVTVRAQTTGDKSYRLSDSLIVRTMQIVFSGPTQPPVADTIGFTIPDGGSFYFNVTVTDDYGNPLVEGSTITVSVKASGALQGDLELTNNVQTLKDRINTGRTFRVGVHDKGAVKEAGLVTFGIEVKSENGDYSNSRWFTAYVSGAGAQTGAFNIPAKIELLDSTVKSLYLAESNLLLETTKTIFFIVKDAFDNPINPSRRAVVNFSFLNQPAGTTLDRAVDSTNSLGIVSVRISSGNTFGTARVVAQTLGETGIVQGYSAPILIARGLPDSNKIFFELSKKNMFNKYGSAVGTISINMIDKDGFAAVPQDLVATTTGGYVTAPPTTVNGKTTISLFGSSNEPSDPTPGLGNVNLTVPVTGGVNVIKRQPFMFSYVPIIYFTNTTIVDTNANRLRDSLADGGTATINYSVRDKNGNPISSGNTIKITASGTAGSEVELSGDIDVKTIDTQNPADANYVFNIKNRPSGIQGAFRITITVTGESGTAVRTLDGYLLPTISAQRIVLATEPTRILSVKGTGTNETSTITFQVTDLANRPIDGTNPVYVDLAVLNALGGATINPVRIQTDGTGKVTATLFSGTRYGTVRVVASFVSGTNTISAPQEIFTITGPHSDNFTLLLSKNNMPGIGNANPEVGKATVTVADSLGGSLPLGTRVNFRTLSGGAVATPALTNVNGIATTSIKGGFIPNDPVRGLGYGTLQAWMIGDYGDTLKRNVPFLLSGVPTTIFFTQDGTNPYVPLNTPIADGGSATVQFKIRDVNWRPVTDDYTISVTIDGDSAAIEVRNITAIRDIINMADTTQICSFQLVDKIRGGGPSGPISVTITVANKDLGSYSTIITGTLAPAPGVISTRVANLKFVASNPAPVYVQSTGLPGVTTLTFALIDSNNAPVTYEKADTIQFSILNGTGREWLSINEKLSDANGQVSTVFHTGVKSGTYTIQARVKNLPTITANTDITVLGGFPAQSKFTLSWNVNPPDTLLNLPGLVNSGELAGVNILALDQYSNPAKSSVIQFDETTAGSLVSVTTDATGRATAKLSGGRPYPVGGFGYVKASTFDGTTFIRDSLRVLFTGAPIVRTSVDTVRLADGERNFAISYFVQDINNRAMSGGTYKVSVDGPASPSISLEGNLDITQNSNNINPTTYHFLVHDNNSSPSLSGWFKIYITVNSPNGNTIREIYGYLNSPVPAEPTLPAKIVNAQGSPSISTMYVKSASLNTSSTVTFQLKDSSDLPIDRARVTTVNFAVVGPGGDEYLSRTSGQTGENGLVTVVVNSGSKPGVITVTANATVSGLPLQTCAVELNVKGAPDSSRSQMWLTKTNYPGLVPGSGVLGNINVKLADEYGNAPFPSTVRFTSTTAMFGEDNPAVTNASGEASVLFSGGGKSPVDGIDTLRMTTRGSNGNFTLLMPVLFSGTPIITLLNVPNDTVRVADGGSFEIFYRVADINGNPITTDNSIKVTISGSPTSDIAVENAEPKILDTQDRNLGTSFKVKFIDKVSGILGKYGEFGITISIVGKNAPSGISRTFLGILQRPNDVGGGLSEYEKPSHAVIKSVTPDNLAVNSASVKDNVSSTIIIEVRDKLDRPIDAKNSVRANYSLSFFPNSNIGGGILPTVSPPTDTSNAEGQLRCIVVSGTQAGVAQLNVEIITKDSVRISLMQPVVLTINGGLPNQAHFNVLPSRFVFPGNYVPEMIKITAVVGDTFSNPVRINTPVYFHSQAGVIGTGSTYDRTAYTDKFGNASVLLNKGAKFPFTPGSFDPTHGPGYFWVYAQTEGNNNVRVIDSVLLVWAIGPIQIINLPGSISFPRGGSSAPISIRITDANLNPLPDGTKITASVEFNSDQPGLKYGVSGDLSSVTYFEMPNEAYARFPGTGVTDFTFTVSDLSSSPIGIIITIHITVEAPNMVRVTRSFPCTVL